MKIYESQPGMYDYKHLPAFAKHILDNHLDAFAADQITFSKELKLPLLKYLSHLSEDQLLGISRQSTSEYLTFLSLNQAKQQLTSWSSKWLNDQFRILGKFEISAEDVTVLNYMRGKLFKKWVREYQLPMDHKYELMDEIDSLMFGAIISATNTFIKILKNKIHQESHFSEQMINTSPGIIFIFDIEKNREVYVNGNVQQVMGYTSEEILKLGNSLLPILSHPDDLPTLAEKLSGVLNDTHGKTHQLEYRFKHKDGSYRWLRTYYTVFHRNAEGVPTQLLGCCFEISNEKETAFALQKREAQLLEAQAIAEIGSFEWDIQNNISTNTPQLQNIFGLQKNKTDNENFLQNVHPLDKEKVEQALAQAFVTGNYDCQYRYIVHGKEKNLWARGVILFKGNQPAFMHGTVQDITQLKKIEEELIKKTRELERSNESLQQFASIASHDLKEPLRKMSMYSDMVLTLEERNISATSQTNLEKVKASAIRMQGMIEDILRFSSINNEVKKQTVSLKKVVRETLDILHESITEKQAKINIDDLPEVSVIATQMRQLFQNLIANALKFAKNDVQPVINICHRYLRRNEVSDTGIEESEQYLELRITDNGIGFKQEDAQKIFALFTRLHSRSSYEGSGLGLSICKRIVDNHGGSIRAESKPGEGSTFIIILPVESKAMS